MRGGGGMAKQAAVGNDKQHARYGRWKLALQREMKQAAVGTDKNKPDMEDENLHCNEQ